jgi:hypothetical protein
MPIVPDTAILAASAHDIRLTQEREIMPHVWVHLDEDDRGLTVATDHGDA